LNSESIYTYDYIIAGGGCAGLSLAYRLSLADHNYRVLVVDSDNKTSNDRTWCFWEEGKSVFEEIVYRSWESVSFYGTRGLQRLDLGPYRYKMIKGVDFYRFVLERLQQDPRFTFLQTTITGLGNEGSKAVLNTTGRNYYAKYIFNSAIRPKFDPGAITYLQHFKGWVIKISLPSFDPDTATLMDFRIRQYPGEARFMYILPFSQHEALVEFTVFSPEHLPRYEYDEALNSYIRDYTTVGPADFEIIHQEFGSIPMSEMSFTRKSGNIYHTGTAGGQTKASTGYTFTRIQKEINYIAEALLKKEVPVPSDPPRRFALYDSTLLDVMANDRHSSADIFSLLFSRNKPGTVLRFLDEDTSLWQEIKLMSTVPINAFIRGMLSSLRRRKTFR
jgi:lycopene beta-cyclase